MVLVDTSAWIEVFRAGATIRLTDVVDFDEVVTCLPVVQEVLQGIRHEKAFRLARDAMGALPIVDAPLGEDVVAEAVDIYRAAHRVGLTPRSSVDCLIAAIAVRHGLTVLHRDRDFELLARVCPLDVRSLGD